MSFNWKYASGIRLAQEESNSLITVMLHGTAFNRCTSYPLNWYLNLFSSGSQKWYSTVISSAFRKFRQSNKFDLFNTRDYQDYVKNTLPSSSLHQIWNQVSVSFFIYSWYFFHIFLVLHGLCSSLLQLQVEIYNGYFPWVKNFVQY